MTAVESIGLLVDPKSGARLVPAFDVEAGRATGVLEHSGGRVAIVRGIAVLRADLGTDDLLAAAQRRDEALAVEILLRNGGVRSRARARWRSLLESTPVPGQPWPPAWAVPGDYGTYLRYRYSVGNAPAALGLLSCLDRAHDPAAFLLDVGCGIGHWYKYALRSYAARRVVLLDSDPICILLASMIAHVDTLLCLADVRDEWCFQREAFGDITAVNAISFLGARNSPADRTTFLRNARASLSPRGTLWLSNVWNPKLTDQYTGQGWVPSEALRSLGDSSGVRLFPDRFFARSVLEGSPIHLSTHFEPEDDHPDWRCFTIADSRLGWITGTPCVPVNTVPSLENLRLNSIYGQRWWSHSLRRRRIQLPFWGSHREYFGFQLPRALDLPRRRRRADPEFLRGMARQLVYVESVP